MLIKRLILFVLLTMIGLVPFWMSKPPFVAANGMSDVALNATIPFTTTHLVDGFFEDVQMIVTADMDSDGDADILGAAHTISEISWWANNGDGSSWTKHVITDTFSGHCCPIK